MPPTASGWFDGEVTRIGRLLLCSAAALLAVVVASGDERGGMPLESRAIVIVGLGSVAVWVLRITAATPIAVSLVGACAVGLWLAVTWSWATPVDSVYGSCGSTLARQQPAADSDGDCDRLVGDAYNADIPVMLAASGSSVAAGAGALLRRRPAEPIRRRPPAAARTP